MIKGNKTPALIIVSGSEGRIEKAQNIAQLYLLEVIFA